MAITAFGIEKEFLRDLLKEVDTGETQLPEFQRGWVWPVENITSLLASISVGYPVGTVMMLKTGGEVAFKERCVEGANPPANVKAERLILDGQQRLTSLYQALMRKDPIVTQDARKRRLEGWFYLDIAKALGDEGDREEAFRFIPADRKVRNFRSEVVEDYSTPEAEYQAGLFPLNHALDPDDWHMEFQEHWDFDRERLKQWQAFFKTVLKPIEQYQLPVIDLGKETPRDAVCQVFEKVNTGGVTLTVFELLTATFAADGFDLRKDWDSRRHEWAGQEFKVLHEVSNTDFLQAVTLLATRDRRERHLAGGKDEATAPRIGARRKDMLALSLAEYREWAPQVVTGLKEAAKFLHQRFIFDVRYLPYGTQLIPLAAILAILGPAAGPVGVKERLARWYWCGVFGELYSGTTETRLSLDISEVPAWARDGGGAEPRTVSDAQFAPGRLMTLKTRNAAAYKGVYALLLAEGARDWRTGDQVSVTTYFDDALDIHHIFPKAWCESENIPPDRYNAIVNKTPLAARTNRIIGGQAPSQYLPKLAGSAQTSTDVVDRHVATHLVPVGLLRADDFEGFLLQRQTRLLDRIGRYMGKQLQVIEPDAVVVDEAAFDEDEDA